MTEEQIIDALATYDALDIDQVFSQIQEAGIEIKEDDADTEDNFDLSTFTPSDDWAGGSMDSISMYLREISQYKIPTMDEEEALTKTLYEGRMAKATLDEDDGGMPDEMKAEHQDLVKKGKAAAKELTERNLRLVFSIARRYQGNGLPLLDLIQSGNMGLMRSLEHFDPSRGFRISTYATWWIRQAIVRELANSSRNIRIPVHVTEDLRKLKIAMDSQGCGFLNKPSIAEIAAEMGHSEKYVAHLMTLGNTISLSTIVGGNTNSGDNDSEFEKFIADERVDLEASSEQIALREALLGVMDDVLSQREKQILMYRFGLTEDGQTRTLNEIGILLGLTRERVRQIEGKALRKMKATSRRKVYEDFLYA